LYFCNTALQSFGHFCKNTIKPINCLFAKNNCCNRPKKLSTYQWQLVDATGKSVSLEAYKGKIIFINFWATSCPPCIAEMPSFQNLYADYQDKIIFLFVTTDSFEKANTFMNKENLTLPVYQSITNPPLEMESSTIPATFLIDKQGNIVLAKIGIANWNSDSFRRKLDQLLKK